MMKHESPTQIKVRTQGLCQKATEAERVQGKICVTSGLSHTLRDDVMLLINYNFSTAQMYFKGPYHFTQPISNHKNIRKLFFWDRKIHSLF